MKRKKENKKEKSVDVTLAEFARLSGVPAEIGQARLFLFALTTGTRAEPLRDLAWRSLPDVEQPRDGSPDPTPPMKGEPK